MEGTVRVTASKVNKDHTPIEGAQSFSRRVDGGKVVISKCTRARRQRSHRVFYGDNLGLGDDVNQQTCLEILEKDLDRSFDPTRGRTPEAYVCGIRNNVARAMARKGWKERQSINDITEPLVARELPPLNAVMRDESHANLYAGIAKLRPSYRRAICEAWQLVDPSEPDRDAQHDCGPVKSITLFRALRRLGAILRELYPTIKDDLDDR